MLSGRVHMKSDKHWGSSSGPLTGIQPSCMKYDYGRRTALHYTIESNPITQLTLTTGPLSCCLNTATSLHILPKWTWEGLRISKMIRNLWKALKCSIEKGLYMEIETVLEKRVGWGQGWQDLWGPLGAIVWQVLHQGLGLNGPLRHYDLKYFRALSLVLNRCGSAWSTFCNIQYLL